MTDGTEKLPISIFDVMSNLAGWLTETWVSWLPFMAICVMVIWVYRKAYSERQKIAEFSWRNAGTILLSFAVLIVASALIEETWEIWLYDGEWTGAATRSIVLALGGLGALYGLILAARRLNVSEKQAATAAQNAATAEKNLFSERLSRAATLLAEEKLAMRVMGVDILEAVARDCDPTSADHALVRRSLLSFVQSQELPDAEEGQLLPTPLEARQQKCTDVERAIQVLGEITSPDARDEINLSNLDLRGLDLRGANLQGADLGHARLQGAHLGWANLSDAILSNVHLQKAFLWNANLQNAILSDAYLQNAELVDANFQGTDLREANLQDANLGGTNLQGADLQKAELQNAVVHLANLQGTNLTRAKLQGGNLWGAKLQGAILRKANLQGAILQEANLQGAILQEANLQDANFSHAKLQGAILWKANLQGAKLREANLQGAILQEANLQGAILQEANLQDTNFSHAKLQGAILWKADCTGASFGGGTFGWQETDDFTINDADLSWADFSKANMIRLMSASPEQIDTIIYDKENPPHLPSGFGLSEDRAYELLDIDGGRSKRRFFVKSDQPWSEKPVDEWVHQEIAAEEAKADKPKK